MPEVGLWLPAVMDPHPTLPYLAHVLDMAKTSMAKVPSSGVCIDRQDWIGVVNPNADDRKTWLRNKNGEFLAVRAMIHSWCAPCLHAPAATLAPAPAPAPASASAPAPALALALPDSVDV